MISHGTFQCAVCKKRHHLRHKKEEYRSYFPERKILICEYCLNEFRTSPEYEHLRPDVDPEDKQKVKKIREYYKDKHIYF